MTKKKRSVKRRKPHGNHSPKVPDIDRPLNERELEELSAYFASACAPDDCMTISMLHGFLCAVLSGPMVMPNEWLPHLWGKEEPGFESEAHMQRIIGLLMRFYNGVAAELTSNPLRFEPLLDVTQRAGAERVDAEAWCVGYGLGMTAHEQAWKDLMQDPGTAMFFYPIVSLGMRGSDPENDEMLSDPETYGVNVAALGKCAGVIYLLWRDREVDDNKGTTARAEIAEAEELNLF
jgi:uncharacterized protein